MNFIIEFKKGQAGQNQGLPLGPGLHNLSRAIGGLQRARYYGIASPPKTGKTTLIDYGFLIHPYLYAIKNNIDIEFIYFSFEIDRVSKEFDIASYFLYYDYGISNITLPDGVKVKGESVIPLSPDYLRGRILDDNDKLVLVSDNIVNLLKKVYENRIVPLFGEYSVNGTLMKKGYIDFIKDKTNPTGIWKYLLNHAEKNGKFIKENINGYIRTASYEPNNPSKYTVVIIDHMRKVNLERNFNLKQSVDKLSDYCTELRDDCGYTFVNVIHTNRNIASQDRLRFAGELLYPTAEDVKESGNVSEDCNYLITMFNPNDDRYKLKEHFGLRIKDSNNNYLFPNLRTLHLVESRHCFYPQHFKTEMLGNVKSFNKIEI